MTHQSVLQTKRYYDRFGRDGWTNRKTNSFYLEKEFTKIAQLWPKNGRVLDIGCAAGIHVPLFLGIGRHVRYHGVDISTQFLKDAQRRYPQLAFTEADISDFNFLGRSTYAGFWANSVFMHIPFTFWDAMFASLEQHLQPKSFGYISLPTQHPSKDRDNKDVRHFTILSAAEQRKYFKKRNYIIKHSGGFNGFTKDNIWRWYILQLP